MSITTVPERLSNFIIYTDGNAQAGVADIQLPSFEQTTETVKGAGLAGEYESPNIGHFQSMKLGVNWVTVNGDMLSNIAPKVRMFDCRGINQVLDKSSGTYQRIPVRVLCRGIVNKSELGKMEKGSPYDASTEMEVTYIKVEIDGKSIIELDKLNYKFVVDGTDYLADERKALGL